MAAPSMGVFGTRLIIAPFVCSARGIFALACGGLIIRYLLVIIILFRKKLL
jgi:hypothetical protein